MPECTMNKPTWIVVRRLKITALLVVLGLPGAMVYADGCKLQEVAKLPIIMENLRPILQAKINGKDASFVLDSGAFFSTISTATAAQYNLKLANAPFGFRLEGVGGSAQAHVAIVKEFALAGAVVKNVELLVAGSEVGGDGLLGQNLLQDFDVEYDLGHGAIHLWRTSGCGSASLAYWLKPGEDYSSMSVEPIDQRNPHTIGYAYINGKKIRVTFDTGAYNSLLSMDAARRAGVKTDSSGVSEAGYSRGLGRGMVKSYVGRFDSFKVGDGEEIHNAKLRFADIDLRFTDMLLGADFFISHRIFVSNKEHKIFLSYSGGPVFDLSKQADSDSSAAAAPANVSASSDSDLDASDLARRGAALAARSEYQQGIALLSKAIAISPNEPEYYFRRGNAYWANHQGDEALADFDHVINLREDFLPAYIPRAELQIWKENKQAALVDLDTVGRLAPKAADLRFSLAEVYDRLYVLPAAIVQYGLWIDVHPDDSRLGTALAGRCLDRALQSQELSDAASDCNTAIRRADKKNANNSHWWVDRAVLRLRTGDLDKGISDCDDALKMMPKNARALYVRGVLESRKNKKSQSEADVASAKSLDPKVAEVFEHFGIVP
jgi:predicted aspartyl protease/tetratricopeptide (TPR) repeat protein